MNTRAIHRGAESLAGFGFSELEALVYCFLLKESPATGYRVSHAIGKPTANTYKAIASLAAKGALTVDDGESKLCRAVPPEELLAFLERSFQERRAAAAQALKEIHRDEADDRIYQLSTVEQALDRARAMLARATGIVLLDAFPGLLPHLKDAIRAAIRRKVRVALQVYDHSRFPGAIILENDLSPEAFAHWPGQQLSLVVDAREHLLALFSRDLEAVHQAVWSQSAFLSCIQHNHLACEFAITAMETLPEKDPRRAEVKSLSLLHAEPTGLKALRQRLGQEG